MAGNTNYCYKGSTEFVIENGILKGAEVPYLTEHNGFGEYILQQLKATQEFSGLIGGATGKEETFGRMMEKSVKCAMWLKEQNVQPSDIIGISTHNQMGMYVPCFASLLIGAVFNPLELQKSTDRDRFTEEELLQLVATKLPDYMALRGGIEFLDELPHSPSQKMSRSDLRYMARSDKAR